jgi:hypothetical protein
MDPATTKNNVTAAANAFFSSELVPIPYGVYAMFDRNGPVFDIDNCRDRTLHTWHGVPGSAQWKWMGDFNRDGYQGQFPTLFALGLHSLRAGTEYPPKEVTDPMFDPVKKGGYGMQPSRFIWEQYDRVPPPTDIFVCIFE